MNQFNVKLPRRTEEHPLVLAVEILKKKYRLPLRHLAPKLFGVKQQSMFQWLALAREDRDYLVPPHRVLQICRLTGQSPHLYDPVVWPDKNWRP